MITIIEDIQILEYKIKKLYELKYQSPSKRIDDLIKKYDDQLLQKYKELEQIKK